MTACFKLMRMLNRQPGRNREGLCTPCVYFGKNLDPTEYPVLMEKTEQCGLGFLPGDGGCTEMRTDNCSTRKAK